MAKLAAMDRLEKFIGKHLFAGMKESRVRRREESMGRTTLTDAMRLHPACKESEDFRLEIWVCEAVGRQVSQAKTSSVEALSLLLGGYLIKAMKASNTWKEGERMGAVACTGGLEVSPHGEDDRLEMMLAFEMGRHILGEAYPI